MSTSEPCCERLPERRTRSSAGEAEEAVERERMFGEEVAEPLRGCELKLPGWLRESCVERAVAKVEWVSDARRFPDDGSGPVGKTTASWAERELVAKKLAPSTEL